MSEAGGWKGTCRQAQSLQVCVCGRGCRHVERQRLDCSPGPSNAPTRASRDTPQTIPDLQMLGDRAFPPTPSPPGPLNSQRMYFLLLPHTSPQGHLQGCGCHRRHKQDNQVLSPLSSRQGTKFQTSQQSPGCSPTKGGFYPHSAGVTGHPCENRAFILKAGRLPGWISTLPPNLNPEKIRGGPDCGEQGLGETRKKPWTGFSG